MKGIYLAIPLIPLAAAVIAGIFGKAIGRTGAHTVTILGVAASFVLSCMVYADVREGLYFNGDVYTWGISGDWKFSVGFLIDSLSSMMMVVVTFVSLMVHIYTIGYMHEDPGYQRFFSYISLFTFAMLMLVMSNNFMQLFFGWEAVGVVSYLLIGFWFKKPTAIFANMKAFLVNRVGDFGFLLGIAGVIYIFGSLDYAEVFKAAPGKADMTAEWAWDAKWMTVIALLLFVGAMGKSAQVPLHVWLPDSMEGPTPISALIHAATMVTAGIFMVARMSPIFELSETALSVVMVIGAITALFMGLIGLVQNDIKRVVAYSTLSQLGYMTVALGASAYAAGVFHLFTHAFFKALLFLGAGSVIIAMHHEQDMRKMGGLRALMPVTYITGLIGSLALAGIPPFAGFFSKDAIIEAVHHSELAGSGFAYFCVLAGVVITAFYSFRLLFMTFHGRNRADEHTRSHLHESPLVVTIPLILLAIPSVVVGFMYFEPMLFGDYFKDAIHVLPEHDTLSRFGEIYGGATGTELIWKAITHGFVALPLYLALLGIFLAWLFYIKKPELPGKVSKMFGPVQSILEKKYGFDEFNQAVFAGGAVGLGKLLWSKFDAGLIDGVLVNGTAKSVGWISSIVRNVQSGYVYQYAFAMIIGLVALMSWMLFRT